MLYCYLTILKDTLDPLNTLGRLIQYIVQSSACAIMLSFCVFGLNVGLINPDKQIDATKCIISLALLSITIVQNVSWGSDFLIKYP